MTARFRARSPRALRTLDFDIETIAAGFGEPDWVPQKVTAIAWSWCDSEHISYATRLDGVEFMFESFVSAYDESDMVTGHNLIRFDLPVLMADLMRNEYPKLKPKRVQDTIRIVKTKGFKKGQDNLLSLLQAPEEKKAMNWQQWENAYEESDWATVIERVVSDVRGHKILRQKMLERNWLRPAVMWTP